MKRPKTTHLSQRASATTFDEVGDTVSEEVQRALLDWLGVTVAGSVAEPSAVLRHLATESVGPAVVIGTDITTTDLVSAVVNGTHGHALDFDDTHAPTLLHASAPVWPALFAIAASRPITGREFIAAYVAGVRAETEIATGIGETLSAKGFHVTGVIGHLGAAIASARLLRLDGSRTEHAIGIASAQSAGLTSSFGSMSKPLQAGKAAMDGLLSAKLAASGFTGPSGMIESPDGLLATLLQEDYASRTPDEAAWPETKLSIKPYPSCLLTHPAIDACLDLAEQVSAARDHVARLDARVSPLAEQLAGNRAPQNGLAAKFSVEYCCARALLSGPPGPEHFTADAVTSQDVQDLARSTTVVADPALTTDAAHAEVVLRDGRTLTSSIVRGTEDSASRTSRDWVLDKFHRLTTPILTSDKAEALAEAVQQLPDSPDVGNLVRLTASW